MCWVTSCWLSVLLSPNQSLITVINTHRVTTHRHTCANIEITPITPVSLCLSYSSQVTQVGRLLISTNLLVATGRAVVASVRLDLELVLMVGLRVTQRLSGNVKMEMRMKMDSLCSALSRCCSTCVPPPTFPPACTSSFPSPCLNASTNCCLFCVQPSVKLWMSSGGDVWKCAFLRIVSFPLYDAWDQIFTPCLSEAAPNNYEQFCLPVWSDNECLMNLFYPAQSGPVFSFLKWMLGHGTRQI